MDLESFEDDEDSGEGSFGDATLYIPQEQSIGDCLEDGKVIKSFWELRQEAREIIYKTAHFLGS